MTIDSNDAAILILRDQGVLAIGPWQETDATQAVRWQNTPNGIGTRLENGNYYFFGEAIEDNIELIDAETGDDIKPDETLIVDPTLTVLQYSDNRRDMIAWGPTTPAETVAQAQFYLYNDEYDSAWLTLLWLSQTDRAGFEEAGGIPFLKTLGQQWLKQIEQSLVPADDSTTAPPQPADITIPGLLNFNPVAEGPYGAYYTATSYYIHNVHIETILHQLGLSDLVGQSQHVRDLLYAADLQANMRLLGWEQVEQITVVDLHPLWWQQWGWRLVVPLALPLLYIFVRARQANPNRWDIGIVATVTILVSYFTLSFTIWNGLPKNSPGPISAFTCLAVLIFFGFAGLRQKKVHHSSLLLTHALALFIGNGFIVGVALALS